MAHPGRPRKHNPIADDIRQAIAYSPVAEAKRLISSVEVDVLDGEARTPLINAVQCGSLELLQWLLESKANPNHQDRTGATALHSAARNRRVAFVATLLQGGSDPNVVDKNGNSPLWEALYGAASEDQLATLQLLMDFGADPSRPNRYAVSPLQVAAESHPEALKILLSRGNGARNA
jgi:ankyrin repeat protein